MTRIGFQLYSLHGIDDPVPTLVECVGDTTFEGVEFAGLGDASPDEVADALARTGLSATGMHVDVEDIENDPVGVAAASGILDCEHIVVPWLAPAHFESPAALDATADRLDDLAATIADHGRTLHYHNHDQEFATVDDGPALERLIANTETVRFEVDLGWVGAAGHDPLSFLDDIGDRVDLVHLKDFDADAGEPTPVGTGDLDVAKAIDLVRTHDVDWLIFEAEAAPDTYDTLDAAHDIVADYW